MCVEVRLCFLFPQSGPASPPFVLNAWASTMSTVYRVVASSKFRKCAFFCSCFVAQTVITNLWIPLKPTELKAAQSTQLAVFLMTAFLAGLLMAAELWTRSITCCSTWVLEVFLQRET